MQFANAFHRSDRAGIGISNREMAVLSVIDFNNQTGICAADVVQMLADVNGKEPRLSTIYDTILSLEKKGLIHVSGSASPDTRGRSRNLFKPSKIGGMAMALGREMMAV